MNTTQLECFVSLASTLNFAKTAEQVYLSQPAVTKEIQSLEQELGAKLFIRTTRSVSLTPVGIQFLPEANTMIKAYYHAKDWISTYHLKQQSALRIGYMDDHLLPYLGKMLGKLKEEYQNLIPEFTMAQTDTNLNRLVHGQLDLVVGIKDSHFNDNSIVFEELHRDGFLIVMREDHPVAEEAKKNGWTSISGEKVWDYSQVIHIPPYLMKNLFSKARGIIPVNDRADNILCSQASEVYSLVKAGFGYAYVPEYLAIPDGELVFFPYAETHRAPFGVYYRKESLENRNPIIKSFLEEAVKNSAVR